MNVNKLSVTNDIRNTQDSKVTCVRVLKDAVATDRTRTIQELIKLLELHKNRKTNLTIAIAETL